MSHRAGGRGAAHVGCMGIGLHGMLCVHRMPGKMHHLREETKRTQVRALQKCLLQQLHRDALLREVEGQGYAMQHVEGDVYRVALPCKVCVSVLTCAGRATWTCRSIIHRLR